jgi:hypothetical protein
MAVSPGRRDLILGLGTLVVYALSPTLAGAQTPPELLNWIPRALESGEAKTLTAACERIMPPTATPGASAFGVPQFVDRAIADWCSPVEADLLRRGLRNLETAARAKFGPTFASLGPALQDELIAAAASASHSASPPFEAGFFPLLSDLVTAGYFTSEGGATKVLRYDPVPGAYHGCVPLREIGRAWVF